MYRTQIEVHTISFRKNLRMMFSANFNGVWPESQLGWHCKKVADNLAVMYCAVSISENFQSCKTRHNHTDRTTVHERTYSSLAIHMQMNHIISYIIILNLISRMCFFLCSGTWTRIKYLKMCWINLRLLRILEKAFAWQKWKNWRQSALLIYLFDFKIFCIFFNIFNAIDCVFFCCYCIWKV